MLLSTLILPLSFKDMDTGGTDFLPLEDMAAYGILKSYLHFHLL